MDCTTCQEQFSELLDAARVTAGEDTRRHLDACPACQEAFRQYREAVTGLRSLPRVAPPEGLLGDIRRAVSAEAGPRRGPVWQPVLAGLAMAACLALVLWGAALAPQPRFEPLVAPRAALAPSPQAAPSAVQQPALRRDALASRAARWARPRGPVAPRRVATGPRSWSVPELGNWAVTSEAAVASSAGTAPGEAPALTMSGHDIPASVAPLNRRPGPVLIRFVPPGERTVGVPVVSELQLASEAEGEATVRVIARRGLRVTNAPEGVLYQGPLRRGENLKLPLRLLATQPGTQRLRVQLTMDVPVGGADMDLTIPGFVGELADPGQVPVSLRFVETPLPQALREMAAAAGVRVVIHEGVGVPVITQDYSAGVPVAAALKIACEAAGCRLEVRDGVYHAMK